MTDTEFADLIESKTTRRIVFDAKDIPVIKPVVYMALSHNQCLYVGMSRKGMARAIRPDHHVLSHIRGEIVKLEVYETRTVADAQRLEAMMIQEFKPKYNDRQIIKAARNTGKRSVAARILERAGY